jgi:hypothetical protein
MRRGTYVRAWLIVALLLLVPSSASAGAPGTWTRVTGQEAWFELNLIRHQGRLHIGVREDESASTYRMIHRSISADGAVGASHTVAQGFNYLGYYPAFVEAGNQLAMNFGAKADGDGYSNSHMMQVASATNGETWSAPLDTMVSGGAAASPSEMDGTLGTGAAYYVWEGTLCICVQRYTGPVADDEHTNFNDIGGNNYDPSIGFDPATGRVWVVYAITGTADGLYAREVNTANGEPLSPSTLLPGSFDTFEGDRLRTVQTGRVPMTQRPQGGVFVAYPSGYPSSRRVRLWRLGSTGFATIVSMRAIGDITITADPNGRLWVVWERGGRVFARRSNPSVTRWGASVRLGTLRNTVGVSTLAADAQPRVVDVLAHSQQVGNSGFFHTQAEPGITFEASPRRFRGAVRVRFETKDAGDPLANSRITVAGESCTTNANGVCFVPLGPYEQRRRLRARAEHSNYAPAKLTLRARPPRR